ncbi:unnamed protein product, partial [Cyprideis torosa]
EMPFRNLDDGGDCREAISKLLEDYVDFHRRACQEPIQSHKYLIFHIPKKGYGGGIADRIKGMILTFFWAIASHRVFLIYWETPFPLTTAFTPHEGGLNWSYRSAEVLKLSKTYSLMNSKKNKKATKLIEQLDQNRDFEEQFIAVLTNSPTLLYGYNNITAWPSMIRTALERYRIHNVTTAVEQALHLLLKPSAALLDNIKQLKTSTGLSETSDPRYVYIHLRMGGSAVPWGDPARHRHSDIAKSLECGMHVRTILQDQQHQSDTPVQGDTVLSLLFFTDSQKVKDAVKLDHPDILVTTAKVEHIDISRNKTLQGFLDSWGELLLMSNSSCIVLPIHLIPYSKRHLLVHPERPQMQKTLSSESYASSLPPNVVLYWPEEWEEVLAQANRHVRKHNQQQQEEDQIRVRIMEYHALSEAYEQLYDQTLGPREQPRAPSLQDLVQAQQKTPPAQTETPVAELQDTFKKLQKLATMGDLTTPAEAKNDKQVQAKNRSAPRAGEVTIYEHAEEAEDEDEWGRTSNTDGSGDNEEPMRTAGSDGQLTEQTSKRRSSRTHYRQRIRFRHFTEDFLESKARLTQEDWLRLITTSLSKRLRVNERGDTAIDEKDSLGNEGISMDSMDH